MDKDSQPSSSKAKKVGKQNNTLPIWGNENSMNLNPLILANIQGSNYFKVHLFKLKTYHEVVDEIYYQVKHMEPWERGSRKTSGQTGMCGGVRGVGAGGIVSSAFCLLYKLYTLRLTRKQVNGLLNHTDSPYIRALGFVYLRYTQPPSDLYDWYEDYLQDEEEIDLKAGGGQTITIGEMVYQLLTKLDWFTTLFPRIPVPIQKQIEKRLEQYSRENRVTFHQSNSNRNNQPTKNFPGCESDISEKRQSSSVNCRGSSSVNRHDYGERDVSPQNQRHQRYSSHTTTTTSDYRSSLRAYDRYREQQRKQKHNRDSRSRSRDRYDRKRDQEHSRNSDHRHGKERSNYNSSNSSNRQYL